MSFVATIASVAGSALSALGTGAAAIGAGTAAGAGAGAAAGTGLAGALGAAGAGATGLAGTVGAATGLGTLGTLGSTIGSGLGLSGTAASVVGNGIVGAGLGAATNAAQGKDPLSGAAMGAVTGGLLGGMGGGAGDASSTIPQAGATAGQSVGQAAGNGAGQALGQTSTPIGNLANSPLASRVGSLPMSATPSPITAASPATNLPASNLYPAELGAIRNAPVQPGQLPMTFNSGAVSAPNAVSVTGNIDFQKLSKASDLVNQRNQQQRQQMQQQPGMVQRPAMPGMAEPTPSFQSIMQSDRIPPFIKLKLLQQARMRGLQ